MTKTFLLAAPLALFAGALAATPASAAPWTGNASQIKAQLVQLDRQIDRARGLSTREERQLHSRVAQLNGLYRSYARGGFTRAELRDLSGKVDSLKVAVARQAHDDNRHPGPQRGHR